MGRVTGKVAIVTGAARAEGLGFATARVLAREGAKVVLTDIDEIEVIARAQELVDQGWEAQALRLDITQEDEWRWVTAHAAERFGRLDILVNDAGITARNPIHEMSLESWNRVIDVDLTSVFLGCKCTVAVMRKQGTGGSLINIASIGSLMGISNNGGHCSSEGGIRQLTKVVAIEGAMDKIRCNCVHRGLIATGILDGSNDKYDRLADSIPIGRWGEPDDIAYPVLFLASDESKYITGAELIVDGGLMAQATAGTAAGMLLCVRQNI